MLSLTKKTDYALIALSHLARWPDHVSSAREIADRYNMPLPVLTNLLKRLSRAGTVQAARGARGGYSLARPAEDITLGDLITVIEGPYQFVQCMGGESEPDREACDLEPTCPVRAPARTIHRRLQEFLKKVTLAELIKGEAPAVPAYAPAGPDADSPLGEPATECTQ